MVFGEYSFKTATGEIVRLRMRQDAQYVLCEYLVEGQERPWTPACTLLVPVTAAVVDVLRQALGASYRVDDTLEQNITALITQHRVRDERQRKACADLHRQLDDVRAAFGPTYSGAISPGNQVRRLLNDAESYVQGSQRGRIAELKQQVADLKAAVRVLEDTLVERVSERAARIDELEGFADKQEATNRALRGQLQGERLVSKMHEDVRNATREILGCTPAEQEDRKAKTLALRVEACDREHTDLVETRAVLRCTPYDNTANKANAIMRGVKALVKLINTVVLSRSLMKGTDPMPPLSAPERESLVRAAAPLLTLFEGED